MFVEAIESGQWLVIDELNRSNFDRAFGQLFTVLSGQAVVLPFKRAGQPAPSRSCRRASSAARTPRPSACPRRGAIVATMNVFDKNLLFEMSYALMRRFAFVEVVPPDEDAYREPPRRPRRDRRPAAARSASSRSSAPRCTSTRPSYAARRAADRTTESRVALRGLLRLLPAAVRGHRRRARRSSLRPGGRAPRRRRARRGPSHDRAGSRGRAPRVSSAAAPASGGRALAGTERVWARLARPFEPERAAEALLGMRHASVRVLAGSLHATSPEVNALLLHMPIALRSLGIATTNRPERCHGEIRGPVQWSETISARGATAGASDLFICTTTARAYDTPENRILVAGVANHCPRRPRHRAGIVHRAHRARSSRPAQRGARAAVSRPPRPERLAATEADTQGDGTRARQQAGTHLSASACSARPGR